MKWIGYLLIIISCQTWANDGSKLWLNYQKIENETYRKQLLKSYETIQLYNDTERTQLAAKELQMAFEIFTGKKLTITVNNKTQLPKTISLALVNKEVLKNSDAYIINSKPKNTQLEGLTDKGLLYATFALIRKFQMEESLAFTQTENPKIKYRMLNHWDNANGTVERGYAGSSMWKWFELPYRVDPRYIQYARANAALGINAVSINNVNASSRFLTAEYLEKIKAVADLLRPYGIQVFISVNFRSPKTLGGLATSDPLDKEVQDWWKAKTDEIYRYIPDFGGYLVKANSEGEPGPQDYGRTHADGANMLANAMGDKAGIVIWRAFVYNADPNGDRFKEGYEQFKPLDGQFHKKVIVQVKNGPIDFMPREPFHPMFGAFPNTPLAMEFQITQEYLGHSTHLVYLAPMFKECLDSDTYAKGEGSTVAKVVDGSLFNHDLSLMAGVANTGSDANWTGHPIGQANWYAFGRLAWNPQLSSEQIADEWTKLTLTKNKAAVVKIKNVLMGSLPTYIKYTYPLGLHHMMGESHHYGPQPWLEKSGRPDWTSVYYHRATTEGIGFDRTGKMSNALSLYHPELQKKWNNAATCDLNYLMWFHHLPWNHQLSTGKTVWNELMTRYYEGAKEVEKMSEKWQTLANDIDSETFANVAGRLKIQEKEALWWRDACYLYFHTFTKQPLPHGLTPPQRTLEDVKKLEEIYHLR